MALKSLARLAACLAALLLFGCAGFKNMNIVTDQDEKEARGFRYYETTPFLLVYTDGKGGLMSQVLYLPDYTKKRSIEPYAYAASNKATLTFDKGRLSEAKAIVDETVVPIAVISALEKIATSDVKRIDSLRAPGEAPAKEKQKEKEKDTLPGPYLFRIYKEGSQWRLSGGQAVKPNGQPSRVEYLP